MNSGIDFKYSDIDKMIKALLSIKAEIDDAGEAGILCINDELIIQASDENHIWIEPISNVI